MKPSLVNEKEIFDNFVRHEGTRKMRAFFDGLLGRPIWWICYKTNGNACAFRSCIESSYEIWNDPRVRKFRYADTLFTALKEKSKQTQPYFLVSPPGVQTHCIPLLSSGHLIGVFGLTGVRKGVSQSVLGLLANHVCILMESSAKAEELKRLSATIRPRAIALSTVHTVHRIINSTLNLEELVSRLAHLTAQVLRVNRCVIYLVDKNTKDLSAPSRSKPKKPSTLSCKAMVGYPKNAEAQKYLRIGIGTEGRVAKTAEIFLRKKFICIPLIDEDVVGILKVSSKKDSRAFNYFDLEILTTLAEEAVIAIKNAQLYEEQRKVTLGTIQSLAVILGTRIPHRGVSPEALLQLALKVAQDLHLNEEEMQALHYATLLKETAKIGIPEEILKKPTKLTGKEYSVLRQHPIKGAKIVQSFESLKPVAPIILYSREKYDGTGYPEGLKGESIPIGARILSVLNAFEAIITGRPYRDQSSLTEAVKEIVKNSGTQFDPKVVEVFTKIIEKEGFQRFLKNVR